MNTNQKLGDLVLSILEFFGILIPGAAFAFLYGDCLLSSFGLSMKGLETIANWVPALLVSIILGHFLHGLSDPLDKLAIKRLSGRTKAYMEAARNVELKLPPEVNVDAGEALANPKKPFDFIKSLFVSNESKNLFYAAFSFIRIHNPQAVTELERNAADFKLFRSLTVLFIFDSLISVLSGFPGRSMMSFIIFCFCAFRFTQLFDWTYALAFDLYRQVREATAP